jgi:hypothetical protein
MPDFLIRNIPAGIAARLDEIARQAGKSKQEFLLNTLIELAGDTGLDPGLVIGYTELKQTELERAVWRCPECNQELGDKRLFLGYTGDFRPFGPVCEFCAVTD